MTSSLHDLAIATEQILWKMKLAHRPKSFWYPYPTLHNVAILEKLSADGSIGRVFLSVNGGAEALFADGRRDLPQHHGSKRGKRMSFVSTRELGAPPCSPRLRSRVRNEAGFQALQPFNCERPLGHI
jgi:hypothetical protein